MFPKPKKVSEVIYFDHAAATYLDSRVKKVMEPFWTQIFANPSSLHTLGRRAKMAIEQARGKVAGLIGARPEEIIFTAGGTESVNLAIFGVARSFSKAHHLITSQIEHHAVLNAFDTLKKGGYKVSYVGVDKHGFVRLEELKNQVRPETVFISIMFANNEIGSVQRIAEIGKWLGRVNSSRLKQGLPKIIFHTDACQAAGFLNINVNKLGVDLLSANGSKIYGPKQTGFLYVKKGTHLEPIIYGGGQEHGLRSGTQNVAGIIGLAKAFELTQIHLSKENVRLAKLSQELIKKLATKVRHVELNGPAAFRDSQNKIWFRLPNNVNLLIKGVEGETLMFYLDAYGIAVSTGSACSTGSTQASHVLRAIGRSEIESKSSIRITLGRHTTRSQITYLLKILPPLIEELRKVKRN